MMTFILSMVLLGIGVKKLMQFASDNPNAMQSGLYAVKRMFGK